MQKKKVKKGVNCFYQLKCKGVKYSRLLFEFFPVANVLIKGDSGYVLIFGFLCFLLLFKEFYAWATSILGGLHLFKRLHLFVLAKCYRDYIYYNPYVYSRSRL